MGFTAGVATGPGKYELDDVILVNSVMGGDVKLNVGLGFERGRWLFWLFPG